MKRLPPKLYTGLLNCISSCAIMSCAFIVEEAFKFAFEFDLIVRCQASKTPS